MCHNLLECRRRVSKANRKNRRKQIKQAVQKLKKLGCCGEVFNNGMKACTLLKLHWQDCRDNGSIFY